MSRRATRLERLLGAIPLMNLIKVECPFCSGEGGASDYFGEFYECYCCNEDGDNEDGTVPLWRLRDYDNQVQAMDDYCDRMARAEGWTDEMQDQLDGETD